MKKSIFLAGMLLACAAIYKVSADSAPQLKNSDTPLASVIQAFTAAEQNSNKLVKEYWIELRYRSHLPSGKVVRVPVSSVAQIEQQFLKNETDRELISNRSVRDGVRYNNQFLTLSTSGKVVKLSGSAFDGRNNISTLSSLSPKNEITGLVTVEEGRGDELDSSLLAQSNPKIVGRATLNDIETVVVEANDEDKEGKTTYKYWLAPSRSYLPVRKIITKTFSGTEWVSSTRVYETTEFLQLRNSWVPKKTFFCNWLTNRQAQRFFRFLTYRETLIIEPLESTQTSIFTPSFLLGFGVTDSTRNLSYVEGGDMKPFLTTLQSKQLPPETKNFLQRVTADNVAATGATKPQ